MTDTKIKLTSGEALILGYALEKKVSGVYGGCYVGDGPEIDRLCELDLVEYAGRVSWIPDGLYKITQQGMDWLKENAE